MSLTLRIIASPEGEAIGEWQKVFPEDGGSIGRSSTSTMVLSDLSRTVSGTHAILVKSSASYRIVDTSTNGLYINGANEPLGLQNQATLNDGDVLDIAGYRLLVSCFEPEHAKAKKEEVNNWQSYDPFDNHHLDTGLSLNKKSTEELSDSQSRLEKAIFSLGAKEENKDHEINFSVSGNKDLSVLADPFLDDSLEEHSEEISLNNNVANTEEAIDNFEEIEESDIFSVQVMESSAYQVGSTSAIFDDISTKKQDGKRIQGISNENAQASSRIKRDINVVSDPSLLDGMLMTIIDRAFERFLEDLSPESIEKMANDFSGSRKFFNKSDYWKFYKALFKRQIENSELSLKFKAYLLESQRVTKYRS